MNKLGRHIKEKTVTNSLQCSQFTSRWYKRIVPIFKVFVACSKLGFSQKLLRGHTSKLWHPILRQKGTKIVFRIFQKYASWKHTIGYQLARSILPFSPWFRSLSRVVRSGWTSIPVKRTWGSFEWQGCSFPCPWALFRYNQRLCHFLRIGSTLWHGRESTGMLVGWYITRGWDSIQSERSWDQEQWRTQCCSFLCHWVLLSYSDMAPVWTRHNHK